MDAGDRLWDHASSSPGSRWGRAHEADMLKSGDEAPDFAVGRTTLHGILREREAVVFFFPKAFTPG